MGPPDDDPVYILKDVMEELDFSGLLACYSDKGRTGFNPTMLHAVVTCANMRGIRAVDRTIDLCQRDLAPIWLTKGQKPRRDVLYDFKGKKLTGEALDELNCQFMHRLEEEGLISLKEPHIDGAKIKVGTDGCTFIWRSSLNYHFAGLPDAIDALYIKYNIFLPENGYDPRHNLGDVRISVIEGMDKIRKVIEEDRKWKLTKHKKTSSNTIIEVDYCSLLEIRKPQKNLMQITWGEDIGFVCGKGKYKLEIQKFYEELEECRTRLMEYRECFRIMGKNYDSYLKTDIEATSMRMKEDYMLSGQSRPAYDVQVAVENYFIVCGYVSSDRTNYHTLIPALKKYRETFGSTLETAAVDSGYCSRENLPYLKKNGIWSYIKPQEHERRKTRVYKEGIGKYYIMVYAIFEDERYHICRDGRGLRHTRTENKEQDGYIQTVEVYSCVDCNGCEHKSKYLYKYNAEKSPGRDGVMKINERQEGLRERSRANIQSEEGILKRQTRSIQIRGRFGDIKENENFRHFNYRSEEKVYKELTLYEIGRNMMEYHRFLHHGIEKYEGKEEQKTA